MPRKPTGRPTGRPPGSGQLGLGITDDQERLSIRIPRELYTRFEAFAAGRSFHRGSPQLARYVREAMEEYLARHTLRQTEKWTDAAVQNDGRQKEEQPQLDYSGQTETVPTTSRDEIRQTETVPAPARDTRQQTDNGRVLDAATLDAMPLEPDKSVPASFDTRRFYLGTLCQHSHRYAGTGQSLRRLVGGTCEECRKANQRKRP